MKETGMVADDVKAIMKKVLESLPKVP